VWQINRREGRQQTKTAEEDSREIQQTKTAEEEGIWTSWQPAKLAS
jgi:hypothetical protein